MKHVLRFSSAPSYGMPHINCEADPFFFFLKQRLIFNFKPPLLLCAFHSTICLILNFCNRYLSELNLKEWLGVFNILLLLVSWLLKLVFSLM